MPANQIVFAGVDVSSGRKPITFAALDDDLNVRLTETWSVAETFTSLNEYENIYLAISVPRQAKEIYKDFRESIMQAGFKPYSTKNGSKQFVETNAQECFRELIGKKPLPRRTLEGRLQRSAVLYEQGLLITDPVDVFEEITRYKLVQGILPLEDIYSSKELDAIVVAYVAWLAINRPGQIALQGEFSLPVQE